MLIAKAFLGTLIAFFMIDLLWIVRVVRPMYEEQVGDLLRSSPQLGAAALFYLIYTAGVVFFAVLPGLEGDGLRTAALNGAALGGLAYGTYAFTNYAMLKGFTLSLAAADFGWGIVLTSLSAACGWFVARLGV